MGTWPIYKKHFLQLILKKKKKKKNFHLIKYLLATLIFFLSFQSVLVLIEVRHVHPCAKVMALFFLIFSNFDFFKFLENLGVSNRSVGKHLFKFH